MSIRRPLIVTPEIRLLDLHKYIIRVDGIPVAFIEDSQLAIATIQSLATKRMRELDQTRVKLTKLEFRGGEEIRILTREMGILWNGNTVVDVIFDIISIPKLLFIPPK
jgi:hypothetical protein